MSNRLQRKILGEYLEKVIFPHMVYLQSGPETQITSLFQVVNPLTGKIFSVEEVKEVIKDKMSEIETNLKQTKEDAENELKGKDWPRLPAWNSKMDKFDFAEAVRQYVRSFHPSKKLLVLNAVQQKTPFMLMDPTRRFTGMDYGYADLLRFLCGPVKSGQVAHFIKEGDNPFYQPIRYPLPDKEGNQQLAMLLLNTRQFYFRKFQELVEMNRRLAEAGHTLETQMELLDRMVHILKEVYLFRMNPLAMSEMDPTQKRPLAGYRKDNYLDLLLMLTTKKRAMPMTFGNKPPKRGTGVEFVDPELRVAMGAKYTDEE